MMEQENKGSTGAAGAEAPTIPSRPLVLGEKIEVRDLVKRRNAQGVVSFIPTHCDGLTINEEDIGEYFRPLAPPVSAGAPLDLDLEKALEGANDAPKEPDLLVVWRDNGEALITTRKHPDEVTRNGPACWPKGIAGYYLESHCRKAIFHPSALEALGLSRISALELESKQGNDVALQMTVRLHAVADERDLANRRVAALEGALDREMERTCNTIEGWKNAMYPIQDAIMEQDPQKAIEHIHGLIKRTTNVMAELMRGRPALQEGE